jgi:FlaA1/EpsC-like NDP-sugar epimerase
MPYTLDFAYDGLPPLHLRFKANGDSYVSYAITCLILFLLILCDAVLSVSRLVFTVLAFAHYGRMHTEQEATWLLTYASNGMVWILLFMLRCYYARSERKGVLRILAGLVAHALFICSCYGLAVFHEDDLPRSISVVSFALQVTLIGFLAMHCIYAMYGVYS